MDKNGNAHYWTIQTHTLFKVASLAPLDGCVISQNKTSSTAALQVERWQIFTLCSPSSLSTDVQVGEGLDLRNQNHPTMCEQLCLSVVLIKSRWIVLDVGGNKAKRAEDHRGKK